MSDYPEHDKMRAVMAETQAAGEFIEWLTTQKVYMMTFSPSMNTWIDPSGTLTEWLAAWKGIDLGAIEAEKRQIIAAARAANERG